MQVAELTYPGVWIDLPNQQHAHALYSLLLVIEQTLTEASVSLNLFEAASGQSTVSPTREEWARNAERRRELVAKYERDQVTGHTGFPDSSHYAEIQYQADVEAKREDWLAGRPPRSYQHALPFLHAKAFLSAVDSVGKLFGALSVVDGSPAGVAVLRESFNESFPTLREVRNSAQHVEDRIRGLGRGGQPLKLKPAQNPMVSAPAGGVLIVDSLNGNKFGGTLANGEHGEIEVSVASLERVRDLVQALIDAFPWKGPKRHYPS
jgi:hypothetical protein